MIRTGLNSRRWSLLLSLLALAFSVVAAASAADVPGHKQKPKQIILNLEQQWRTATLNADAIALDRLLSDDYVGISWNGQVSTKVMQIQRLKNHIVVLTRLDLSDVKVKVSNSIAVVTSSAQIDGVNDGVDLHGLFRYTRVYQKTSAGVWKITNFESTRVLGAGQRAQAALK